ncbi:hypothetical protein FIBSPDRAFT_156110 [Athelia psychrophila]|uniref:Uncharacterized protein n=1 Tax=Athelia psychrophila TaxID=1759441 RepID=A0A166BC47_9AGAM|nr:hypothetical protein FIBSPDRAFT_156110 [Fibularhizoctonia sp. CBS 109695]
MQEAGSTGKRASVDDAPVRIRGTRKRTNPPFHHGPSRRSQDRAGTPEFTRSVHGCCGIVSAIPTFACPRILSPLADTEQVRYFLSVSGPSVFSAIGLFLPPQLSFPLQHHRPLPHTDAHLPSSRNRGSLSNGPYLLLFLPSFSHAHSHRALSPHIPIHNGFPYPTQLCIKLYPG